LHGFVFPIEVVDATKADLLRKDLERAETELADDPENRMPLSKGKSSTRGQRQARKRLLDDGFALYNVNKPPFNDPRVRQAMQMALDLETIKNRGRVGERISSILQA
jgi:ABC-type oligopeptide transport system substrate-binding subunit